VTGVDACRDGWAGVDLDTDGDEPGRTTMRVTVRVAGSLAELLADAAPGQVVGIDMPLGLLASGWRTGGNPITGRRWRCAAV
jgi:predicted RNase H-like nuclease